MLKIITIISTLLLIVTITIGLHAKIERKVTTWLEINRLLYVVLLAAAIIYLILSWQESLLIKVLWILIIIISYIVMEVAFRLKRETFGNPYLAVLLIIILLGNLVLELWI